MTKGDPNYFLHVGGEKLPSYVGIRISHYKDPVMNQSVFYGSCHWWVLLPLLVLNTQVPRLAQLNMKTAHMCRYSDA